MTDWRRGRVPRVGRRGFMLHKSASVVNKRRGKGDSAAGQLYVVGRWRARDHVERAVFKGEL